MRKISVSDYRKGNFPIDCDTVLKVTYRKPCGLSYELFIGDSLDAAVFVSVCNALYCVRDIYVSSIDDFNI